jgi:hypothetical protein
METIVGTKYHVGVGTDYEATITVYAVDPVYNESQPNLNFMIGALIEGDRIVTSNIRLYVESMERVEPTLVKIWDDYKVRMRQDYPVQQLLTHWLPRSIE